MRSLRFVVFLSTVVAPMVAFAQPAPPAPPAADLRIVKTYRPSPPAFLITVTNHGPFTVPGPITVTDPLPAGAQYVQAQSTVTGWTCNWSSNLVCTRPGGLAPGNSATLVLALHLGGLRTALWNCASVSAGPAAPPDPNVENNRDCACIDVNPCREVRIDLGTGRENGQNLTAGAQDLEWEFVSGTTSTPTRAASSPWTATAFGTGGTFISHALSSAGVAQSVAAGPYRYDFRFQLGPGWSPTQCRLNIRFAADNSVTFQLNGGPVFAQTPANLNPPQLAWTQLTNGSVALPGGGAYTLTANVTNGGPGLAAGPTGLYVTGDVTCTCDTAVPFEKFPDPT